MTTSLSLLRRWLQRAIQPPSSSRRSTSWKYPRCCCYCRCCCHSLRRLRCHAAVVAPTPVQPVSPSVFSTSLAGSSRCVAGCVGCCLGPLWCGRWAPDSPAWPASVQAGRARVSHFYCACGYATCAAGPEHAVSFFFFFLLFLFLFFFFGRRCCGFIPQKKKKKE